MAVTASAKLYTCCILMASSVLGTRDGETQVACHDRSGRCSRRGVQLLLHNTQYLGLLHRYLQK